MRRATLFRRVAPMWRVTTRGAAVLVVAAACTGDNSSSSTPTSAPSTIAAAPSSTTTAPSTPPKFTFGFVAPSAPLLLPLAFAQENALALAVADINEGGGVL